MSGITEAELGELERLEKAATRPIPGIPGYEADAQGLVWSTASNWRGYGRRALASRPDQYGYPKVRVLAGGRRKTLAVHKLVALAFHGVPATGLEVRHLDGNPSNNRPDNLKWGTRKENAADREAHGRTARGDANGARQDAARTKLSIKSKQWHSTVGARGEECGMAKLTECEVRAIRERRSRGEKLADIAADYGVTFGLVSLIAKRKVWKHVA